MRRKLLFLITFFLASEVHAQSAWDRGYSTWTATGVICTTGTSVQLNGTRQVSGFNIGGYRLNNLDSADSAYIGNNTSVSTYTATALALSQHGERVVSGGSVSYELGSNPDLADQPDVELWCRAVDAAGAGGVLFNLVSFGFK